MRTFELAVLDTHVDLPLHVSVGGSMGAQKIPFADLWAGNMSSSALDGECMKMGFAHSFLLYNSYLHRLTPFTQCCCLESQVLCSFTVTTSILTIRMFQEGQMTGPLHRVRGGPTR